MNVRRFGDQPIGGRQYGGWGEDGRWRIEDGRRKTDNAAMAMDVPTLRKLLALDPDDPLSRFALGKKLFETSDAPADLEEAASHLAIANEKSPAHLATYNIYGQVLM